MKSATLSARILSGSIAAMLSTTVLAVGQVDSILVSERSATPFSYTVNDISFDWGQGSNQIMDGFVADGRSFAVASVANEVDVLRDDILGVTTDEPCGVFVERLAADNQSITLAADFASDGSALGNCQLETVMQRNIINRGLLDAFSNTAPDAKNIERIDYLFFFGALAPLDPEQLHLAGHAVAEKSGNNPVKIAAILSIDSFGQPDEFGPLVLINANGCVDPEICYGATDLVHDYSFLQNEFVAPQGLPVETGRSRETVNMAFVSTADLGLSAGQQYHGFSLFADDVDADQHILTDIRTFPNDTSDDFISVGDDADLYGGLTGYFLADELDVLQGALFLDVDLDGVRDSDEAGLSDITVSLFNDVNNNGVFDESVDTQIGDTLLSNTDGTFVFPGLPDGNFIAVLDESDPQIPAGLVSAPGSNPIPVVVAGTDADPVNFAFVSDSGSGSGSDNDGDNGDGNGAGGDDAGGDDAGGNDDGNGAGGDDAGGNDDGNGAGGDDAGGNDDGNGAGGDDAGGNDDGNGAGGDDAGGNDDGNGAGGDDAGGNGDGNGAGGDNDGSNGVIADETTAAVSDQFEVNQGTTLQLDVLANDMDGAGNGLRIIAVSESPNATITISEDGQSVIYNPNAGYFSPDGMPDTFTYTLEDSDGTQRTGNVAVTVIRFSDLNGNAVNDFTECNCDNLFLETGLDGSGIGSISRYLLLLFALIGLVRYYSGFSRKLSQYNGAV